MTDSPTARYGGYACCPVVHPRTDEVLFCVCADTLAVGGQVAALAMDSNAISSPLPFFFCSTLWIITNETHRSAWK